MIFEFLDSFPSIVKFQSLFAEPIVFVRLLIGHVYMRL